MKDAEPKQDVEAAFDFDPRIDRADFGVAVEGCIIGVVADNGKVVPAGRVHGLHDRMAAERTARVAPGVRSVKHDLTVSP